MIMETPKDKFSNNTTPVQQPLLRPGLTTNRPPTSLRYSRGNLSSSYIFSGGNKTGFSRPSTAVRAVGYGISATSATGQRFDQVLAEKSKQQTMVLEGANGDKSKELSPQMKYKHLESKIAELVEMSIHLATQAEPKHPTLLANSSLKFSTNQSKSILAEALSKAKEAFSLDRTLHRFRDHHGENIFHNFDLTYTVFFNLAQQYENNDIPVEALNTYSIMTKNKMFPLVNQLKLNMGNIYQRMGLHAKALKMYRMAFDSVPNNLKQLRLKITRNIGILFIQMGQYSDAAASFEFIMAERADIQSGVQLVLCYYALGDVAKIKSSFQSLCEVQSVGTFRDLDNDSGLVKMQERVATQQEMELVSKSQPPQSQQKDKFETTSTAEIEVINSDYMPYEPSPNVQTIGKENNTMQQGLEGENIPQNRPKTGNIYANNDRERILQALKTDELAFCVKKLKADEKKSITMIVHLISTVIKDNYNDGYNWCIEVIKNSNLSWLANELEWNKALIYLRQNDIQQSIEAFQLYEHKSEDSLTVKALINLSFIYINLGDYEMAESYLNKLNDAGLLHTNAKALCNSAVIDYLRGNFSVCRNKLEKALDISTNNFEINYNLGLVALKQNDLELAEQQFTNLRNQLMIPHSLQHSHVYYQQAKVREAIYSSGTVRENNSPKDATNVLDLFLQVLGMSATEIDSRLLEKIGNLYEDINNNIQANQYYNEAYRINPSDISIANSIGSYCLKVQSLEKALHYFERAILAEPNSPAHMLRVANCFRNSYLPIKQYVNMYVKIYELFPDNVNVVRALVDVTKNFDMTDLNEKYTSELNRLQRALLERENEQRYQHQRLSSAVGVRLNSSNPRRYGQEREISHISSNFNSKIYPGQNTDYSDFQYYDPLGSPAERQRTALISPQKSHDTDEEDIDTANLLPT